MSGALLGAKTSKWHVDTDLLEQFCYSVRRRAQSPERQNWTLAPRRSPSVSTLEPLHEPGTTITVVEFCAKRCAGGQVTLRSHSPSLATMGDRSQHATLVLTLRIAIENSLSRNASPSLYKRPGIVPCTYLSTVATFWPATERTAHPMASRGGGRGHLSGSAKLQLQLGSRSHSRGSRTKRSPHSVVLPHLWNE